MKTMLKALGAVALLALMALPAAAQTLVLDQIPAPAPTSTVGPQSELYTQYQSVPGGAIYQGILKQPNGQLIGLAQTFVPGGGGSIQRYLSLTDGKSDLGVPMTAAAGTPSGTVGVSRTAGTSLMLAGETTSGNAKTDKVIFEFNLPTTYVAGANIPVVVNANYSGSGTITGGSTTITAQLYTETNGVEAAVTTSAAQQFTSTPTNYTFTVTGTSLAPGQHVVLELTMLVTSASGANTGLLNSVSYTG